MFEDEHSQEGLDDSVDVSDEGQMEIVQFDLTVILESLASCKGQIEVKL